MAHICEDGICHIVPDEPTPKKETIRLSDDERTKCEVWTDVPDFAGRYKVSSRGNILSCEHKHKTLIHNKPTFRRRKAQILKQWRRGKYRLVDLWKNGKRFVKSVHVLVYTAFKGTIPFGFYIHHKDGDKDNNSIDNLEAMNITKHNRLHHEGKPSWNKGLHTGNQYTRRKANVK